MYSLVTPTTQVHKIANKWPSYPRVHHLDMGREGEEEEGGIHQQLDKKKLFFWIYVTKTLEWRGKKGKQS